ncbi:RagB/SusD family nutrient uptake outer membrane protein [Bacteroides heparinolyticus]|uniref:RagB/SusD family nutrient uptake outer membrane protein n=1 Tax=Prevotella heparinolytica TaxID=28113 RepID=UPI0023F1189A|nr:RagB/SusD family nutrient uptake outer membrane protein [Bacteroides heparinolyticus]MCF0255724.1 RagB/SusD family nutrient uptake outer membrane protein [Bacteroides heparinolyticus]MCI6214121.1 RagB/SusD family nutrient uptake outer membrane protein [Bacteroides heparinolyticus]
MKNNIKTIVLGLCMAGIFTACDLDVLPPANMATETFWKTEKDAWYGLNACYAELEGAQLPDECCTDNSHSHKPWEGNMELLQQDGIGTAAAYGNYSFRTVRLVNTFLANVDACQMDAGLKERMKAEARCIRAWKYLYLTTRFGKVSVIRDVLEYDAPNVARDPVETVRQFILDELEDVAKVLPAKYSGGNMNEVGRITRWGALALRARAALYFGNYVEAEKSAGEIIDKSEHNLFKITSLNIAQQQEADEMDTYIDFADKGIDKDKFIKGMFSYEALWFDANANPSNPEYVLTREYAADSYNNDWMRYTYMIPMSMSAYEGYISYEPMQDLVDAYWDIDGKTLRSINPEKRKADFEAMWKDFEQNKSDQKKYQEQIQNSDLKAYAYMKEFRNRDSRLYASLMFPFKGWHELKGTYYFMYNPKNINNNGNESWSGYAFRKMVALEPYNEYYSPCDYPIIRFAEVLLTYAEARIHTTGWDDKVQSALNRIRERCGMPNVPVNLSGNAALDFVRNERRIELAGEGQRFDDIRRYGSTYCQKVMNGVTYTPIMQTLVNKKWSERLLLMPIPQSAIDQNPLLKDDQNPGYN